MIKQNSVIGLLHYVRVEQTMIILLGSVNFKKIFNLIKAF